MPVVIPSASRYDYWTSQTLGGGPDVVDVHVNGTYYSDVAGFDYIIGDDGKTYYHLNTNINMMKKET